MVIPIGAEGTRGKSAGEDNLPVNMWTVSDKTVPQC
jgi:hypothetical protein